MDSGQVASNLLVMVVTFLFAAFFVASEFALVQSRPTALEDMLDKGEGNKKKIRLALKMVTNLNEYLSTTQIGVSLAGLIMGWIGEDVAQYLLINLLGLVHLQLPDGGLHIIGAVLGIVILTYLEVVLTEIVPKNIAIDFSIKTLMFIVTPLHYFHVLFYPFVWFLNYSSTAVLRLFGMKPAEENSEAFSQAEILSLSKSAVATGQLEQNDVVYMKRAFEFNDKTARDVMVDRTQLIVVDINDTVKDVLRLYLQEGFSRFPVVANRDKDKILGYTYVYDLIRQAQVDDSLPMSKVLRAIVTVPEVTPIQTILQKMIKSQSPIVVVSDEYGGTSGIVTDKDIYEELFGTVKDEIDDVSDEYILKTDKDNVFKVSGKTTLYDFERFFRDDIPDFEKSDIITVGGSMMESNPEIKQGDEIDLGRYHFLVSDYERGFVKWFTVTVDPEPNKSKKEPEKEEPEE
ncbi:hemolysin family protein [Lacticaseibacillus zhaodongensis]|uniref:hemolysin family protein n=1 Tax=Lacticaseibacillus zhaodongensis TaxID=2668065 RepID=UPI0012D2E5CE|nr:hemolysin family protein [Lacticaseibacillus zhaodongensis]